jgi:TIR domain
MARRGGNSGWGQHSGAYYQGLENSRFVVLVITPEYFDSPSGWPDAEWHVALHIDPDNRKHRLIPILAADCPYIPYLLRNLRNIDIRGDDYKKGLRELSDTLREQPLAWAIAHRGQLIASGGRIDKAQLVAERASIDAFSPSTVAE